MILRKSALAVTGALLALLLLACGFSANLFGGDSEPTATAAPTVAPAISEPTATAAAAVAQPTSAGVAEPTATQAPAAEPTAATAPEEEAVDVPSMSALDEVDSYSAAMEIQMTSPEDGSTVMQVHLLVDVDRVNNAQHLTMSSTEDGEEMAIEMITIGQDSWISLGAEGWMHTRNNESIDTNAMAGSFLGTGQDMLDAVTNPRLVASGETVNGMVTDHYAFDQVDTARLDQTMLFTDVSGEFWLTQDRKFVVRMVMHATGKLLDEDENATMDMTWDLLSVNQPLNIQPPAGYSEEDMLPIMEGALSDGTFFSTPEMAAYEIEASAEDVMQWYEDTLTADGWTQESEDSMEGTYMATYSKDGMSTFILVSTTGTDGKLSVTITRN